jgi:hypothetical protein
VTDPLCPRVPLDDLPDEMLRDVLALRRRINADGAVVAFRCCPTAQVMLAGQRAGLFNVAIGPKPGLYTARLAGFDGRTGGRR